MKGYEVKQKTSLTLLQITCTSLHDKSHFFTSIQYYTADLLRF